MDVNGAVWCLVWAPAGAGGAAVNGTASLPQEPASEGLGWISRPQAELRHTPPPGAARSAEGSGRGAPVELRRRGIWTEKAAGQKSCSGPGEQHMQRQRSLFTPECLSGQ